VLPSVPTLSLLSAIKSNLAQYNNASEVVRAGLRLLEDEQNRLQLQNEAMRAAITAGINSGVSISAEDVFERLETKYKKQPNLKTDGN